MLSDDQSCRDALSRIIAHRAANGVAVCSPNTASYCNARSRILTDVLRTLAKRTAQELQRSAADEWKWNGRSVFIVDGSHVSMPDTPENQASHPQPEVQQPGIGFPLARLAVLLSLATGACHDLAIALYTGKGAGETTLLRQMYDSLSPGDVIVWPRPQKPRGMSGERYRSYPESLIIRQVSVAARGRNTRVRLEHRPLVPRTERLVNVLRCLAYGVIVRAVSRRMPRYICRQATP